MGRILLEPAKWERPYLRRYEQLSRDLEQRGFDVELIVPEPLEDSGPEVLYDVTILLATPDLIVHLASHMAEHALDILEGALLYHLVGRVKTGPKQGMPRRAPILGPRGEVLRQVKLPPGDDEGGDQGEG